MHVLAVYANGELLFEKDLSPENSIDSYAFHWLYLTQCLTSISSSNHLLCLYAWF